MNYNDMTDEEILAEIRKLDRANREKNQKMMDSHNVPQVARRGFYKATGYGREAIISIEPYKKHWIVQVGNYEFASLQSWWLVGPRGKATQTSS